MSNKSVNLNLLKTLVSSLDETIQKIDGLESSTEDSNNECILELSKAYGMVASIAEESTLLAGDVRKLIRAKSAVAAGAPDKTADLISSFFGGKTPGGTEN